jgi:hypothetical protein
LHSRINKNPLFEVISLHGPTSTLQTTLYVNCEGFSADSLWAHGFS